MEMRSDPQWSMPASLFSQLLPFLFYRLLCPNELRTIPLSGPSASSPPLPPAFTSFTPPSSNSQSPRLPHIPPLSPLVKPLPLPHHCSLPPLSSCPLGLVARGRERKPLPRLMVIPRPSPSSAPSPKQAQISPYKRQEADAVLDQLL